MFNEDSVINPLAADMYAAGVILWQLWFKESPYAGKSLPALLRHVLKGKRLPFKGGAEQGASATLVRNSELMRSLGKDGVKRRPSNGFSASSVSSIDEPVDDSLEVTQQNLVQHARRLSAGFVYGVSHPNGPTSIFLHRRRPLLHDTAGPGRHPDERRGGHERRPRRLESCETDEPQKPSATFVFRGACDFADYPVGSDRHYGGFQDRGRC